MFGHKDEQQDDQTPQTDTSNTGDTPDTSVATQDAPAPETEVVEPTAATEETPAAPEAAPEESQAEGETTESAPAEAAPAEAAPESAPEIGSVAGQAGDQSWQHPDAPAVSNDPEKIKDIISPAGGFPKKPDYQYPSIPEVEVPAEETPAPAVADSTSDDGVTDLIDIKKQALGELSPLIDQLDLAAEDKFRIVMMMVQTTDDQGLVKAAYEAAHAIEDEKVRAQALLDVINEVNYFTHQPEIGKTEHDNDESPEEAAV